MGISVSVVIPAYNAAGWLKPTISHLTAALQKAGFEAAEIIIVNDGSTDNTLAEAQALKSDYPIIIKDGVNQGRFLARKTGLLAACYDYILFIDSRVFIHAESLAFLRKEMQSQPHKVVWNGHVNVDKQGNIIARFGDAITFIGWRRYFKNPRMCSYGLEDFDNYPKGTGYFLAPRKKLLSAVKEFESQTIDIINSSDDTHLIRIIARDHRINLSPKFSCTYHARTKISQFVKHSYFRGKTFVDGFLRPGNRFFVPLILFLIVSLLSLGLLITVAALRLPILVLAGIVWIGELAAALLLGLPPKDAASLWLLSPLFAVCYGAGIWYAVLRLVFKKEKRV